MSTRQRSGVTGSDTPSADAPGREAQATELGDGAPGDAQAAELGDGEAPAGDARAAERVSARVGAEIGDEHDTVPRGARWLVGVLLGALVVAGVAGLELWPITGWKLFSLSRDASQTTWVAEAVAADGSSRPVDLEELPLGYRHAEWPMAELPGASTGRRQAVCAALLGAVVDVEPDTVALNITRDRQRLVERDGEWVVTHDPEVVHTCIRPGAGEVAR